MVDGSGGQHSNENLVLLSPESKLPLHSGFLMEMLVSFEGFERDLAELY